MYPLLGPCHPQRFSLRLNSSDVCVPHCVMKERNYLAFEFKYS